MTAPNPHSTLRELRAHLSAPFVVIAQAGVAVILGVSGPFQTWDALTLGARLAYWGVIVFGTYALGAVLTVAVIDRLDARGIGTWARVALGGALIGGAASVFVVGINLLAFGPGRAAALISPMAVALAFIVGWLVLALRALLPAGAPVGTAPPALLRRLPLDRRGALIALSVQDHYVSVITTRGEGLVLMRLSDAIAEAAPTPGVQIHRSHWVALDQVQSARRQGDGAIVTLRDGRELPVSRSRLADVRAAGLLP